MKPLYHEEKSLASLSRAKAFVRGFEALELWSARIATAGSVLFTCSLLLLFLTIENHLNWPIIQRLKKDESLSFGITIFLTIAALFLSWRWLEPSADPEEAHPLLKAALRHIRIPLLLRPLIAGWWLLLGITTPLIIKSLVENYFLGPNRSPWGGYPLALLFTFAGATAVSANFLIATAVFTGSQHVTRLAWRWRLLLDFIVACVLTALPAFGHTSGGPGPATRRSVTSLFHPPVPYAAAPGLGVGCTSSSVTNSMSRMLWLSSSPYTITVRPDGERAMKSGCLTRNDRPSPM